MRTGAQRLQLDSAAHEVTLAGCPILVARCVPDRMGTSRNPTLPHQTREGWGNLLAWIPADAHSTIRLLTQWGQLTTAAVQHEADLAAGG